MKLGIVKENRRDEHRVAIDPGVAGRLVKAGWELLVERGAGVEAGYSDEAYGSVGATLVDDAKQVWQQVDVLAKIRPPTVDEDGSSEVDWLREGAVLISFIFPGQYPQLVERLA